ncbi:hypothetical protein OUZ56_027547 [Daphnia magna]|uniref:Uncharacterized protein n=1 Tax=Daphnia magna TaxID=35525 RepID=A0ABQ9ZQ36_9CRUS|nr:hypothetical protein OUZ56_027547 [Daphnia magna]
MAALGRRDDALFARRHRDPLPHGVAIAAQHVAHLVERGETLLGKERRAGRAEPRPDHQPASIRS